MRCMRKYQHPAVCQRLVHSYACRVTRHHTHLVDVGSRHAGQHNNTTRHHTTLHDTSCRRGKEKGPSNVDIHDPAKLVYWIIGGSTSPKDAGTGDQAPDRILSVQFCNFESSRDALFIGHIARSVSQLVAGSLCNIFQRYCVIVRLRAGRTQCGSGSIRHVSSGGASGRSVQKTSAPDSSKVCASDTIRLPRPPVTTRVSVYAIFCCFHTHQ